MKLNCVIEVKKIDHSQKIKSVIVGTLSYILLTLILLQ